MKEILLDFITRPISKRNLDDMTPAELRQLRPFLNALVKKEAYAYDEWAPTKADQGFRSFILLDYNSAGVLLGKGNINWQTGDCSYTPHMFSWYDYGTKWAFTLEELEPPQEQTSPEETSSENKIV